MSPKNNESLESGKNTKKGQPSVTDTIIYLNEAKKIAKQTQQILEMNVKCSTFPNQLPQYASCLSG